MSVLTAIDDRAFLAVNDFARDTPWLHGPAVDFAKYGVVLFGLAIVAAVVYSRWHEPRATAAAVWAGLGTMVAVAVRGPCRAHSPKTIAPSTLPITTAASALRRLSPKRIGSAPPARDT